tara:strand:+ start:235 stop:354 length:120 start_codon:yes stop_codon:yes gene_type:complete
MQETIKIKTKIILGCSSEVKNTIAKIGIETILKDDKKLA